MISMIIAALLFFQQQQSRSVHLPSSDAIDVARKLARDLGFPIDRYPRLYYFDVVTDEHGQPPFAGYVSITFWGDIHPIKHFDINEETGQVVESLACEVYDFPDLRVFQKEQQHVSGSRPRTIEELKNEFGCDQLKVVRNPIVPRTKPAPPKK